MGGFHAYGITLYHVRAVEDGYQHSFKEYWRSLGILGFASSNSTSVKDCKEVSG